MAYTRTNWVSGSTPLSADNMNNIEDGIEELVDKAMVGKGDLPASANLANVKINGIYRLNSSNVYEGLPSGVTGGTMLVFSGYNKLNVVQCIFTSSHLYFRMSDSSSWSSWVTL